MTRHGWRPKSERPEPVDYSVSELGRLGLLHLKRGMIYLLIKRGEIVATRDEFGLLRVSTDEVRRLQAKWTLDPEQEPDLLLRQAERRERGAKGGHSRAALYTRLEMSVQAQAGRRSYFERLVDPEGTLPPAELARMVQAAKQAQMDEVRRKGVQRKMLEQQYQRRRKGDQDES